MKRLTLAAVVLAGWGCGSISDRRLDRDLTSARAAILRGELAEASTIVDRADAVARSRPQSTWPWQVRLLRAEIALLKRDGPAANAALTAIIPPGPAYDPLRARQAYLRAKQNIDDGKAAEALSALEGAQSLVGDGSDIQLEMGALGGQIRLRLGQWAEAESALTRVAAQARERSDRYHESLALNNLGMSRFVRGRYDEALPYFEHVLSYDEQRDLSIYAVALSNAGACYARLGDFDRAMKTQRRAFEIHQTRGPRVYFEQALGQMGNLEALMGNARESADHFARALAAANDAGLTGDAEVWAGNLAAAYVQMQRWDEAERYNEEARRLWSATHSGGSPAYHTLYSAAIAAGRGRFTEATRLFDEALASPTAPPSLRWDAHFGRANVAVALHQPEQASRDFESALRVIETTRSGLLKTEYKVSYLTQLISFYQAYVTSLVERGDIGRALEVADSSRSQVLAERQRTAVAPRVPVDTFRRVAQSSRTVLLSYWLAPSKSYLFVVAPTGISCLELPAAGDIEKLVDDYRAAIANVMVDPLAGNTAGDSLYRLLVAPAARWLPRGASVIVVPDGALHGINFESLPVASVGGDRRHYWIEDVEIQIAPSLAGLVTNGDERQPGARSLLLIGNPTPRTDFPALSYASAEMESIAAHFPDGRASVYDGARASPETYRTVDLQPYAFVHFTAHATANAESPLDSAVVLSGPDNAFKLYARDVAGRALSAELVTVSACRSAGARAYAGEGLVGFSWAFLHAGARRVIAGLWDVDDHSTSVLMDHLYDRLAAGDRPPSALRDAKLTMLRSGGRLASPYGWAAFEIFTSVP